MRAAKFISGRLNAKAGAAVVSIAVSFVVMIVAGAVSAGFRAEIHSALSDMGGDLRVLPVDFNIGLQESRMHADSSLFADLAGIGGVSEVRPVIYRPGIAKGSEDIQGVVFKGIPFADSVGMRVTVPRRLASMLRLKEGDRMLSYFVGESLVMRNFEVGGIYDGIVTTDDKMVVVCDIDVLRRINRWQEGDASALELRLDESFSDASSTADARQSVSYLLYDREQSGSYDGQPLLCTSLFSEYPQLFDWLHLIDSNVAFILVLMTIVAGLNMVVGLLILLFENISTIGLLKSMGMRNRGIAEVFLRCSSALVLKGMLWGNAVGISLCLLQKHTHLLTLDPNNYFISFVPMHMDIPAVLMCDAAAYVVIMLVLLIPCRFISGVRPSSTLSCE